MPPDLRLGTCRYDLAHRALVAGTVEWDGADPDRILRTAGEAVSAGAGVLAVVPPPLAGEDGRAGEDAELDGAVPAVESLCARFGVPVALETSRARVLRAAAKAGAVLADDPSGFGDPAYLPVAAEFGLAVVAHNPRTGTPARALAEGLAPEAVVIAVGLDETGALARPGHTCMLTVPPSSDGPSAGPWTSVAMAALAVTRGARIVRTPDVAATVRAVRMIERILSA